MPLGLDPTLGGAPQLPIPRLQPVRIGAIQGAPPMAPVQPPTFPKLPTLAGASAPGSALGGNSLASSFASSLTSTAMQAAMMTLYAKLGLAVNPYTGSLMPASMLAGLSGAPATTKQAATSAPVSGQAVQDATGNGTADSYKAIATSAAQRYGFDPSIFTKQINQESGFDPNARSSAGAVGIAQFMPGTAQGMGIDPTDPVASLDAAAKLMASYVQKYGSIRNALIAYNAGPGTLEAYLNGQADLPAETQRYLDDILGPGNGS